MSSMLLSPYRHTGVSVSPFLTAALALNPLAVWMNDDAAGTTAKDWSGNSHDMTETGTITQGASPVMPVGSSASMDFPNSAASYMSVSAGAWMAASSFTVCAWVYADALDSYRCILSRDSTGGTRGWSLYITNGSMNMYPGGDLLIGNIGLATGRWYFVAVTYNSTGTVLDYWLGLDDGRFVNNGHYTAASINNSFTSSPYDMFMGVSRAGSGGLNFPWDGRIGPVAYFGSQLSAAELETLFLAGTGDAFAVTQEGGAIDAGTAHAKLTFGMPGLSVDAIRQNDLFLAGAMYKDYTGTVTTPAGWTPDGSKTSGTTPSNGNPGQGSVGLKTFTRVASGAETDLVFGGSHIGVGKVLRLRAPSTSTTWDVQTVTGADSTPGDSSTTATADVALDVVPGDKVYFMVASPSSQDVITGISVSIPGCTVSSVKTFTLNTFTTDPDGGIYSGYVTVLTGSPTGPPTLTGAGFATISVASVAFMRVRAISAPAVTFIGYAGSGNDTVSASGTGRTAGDLLVVTAVGSSALTTPSGFTAAGETNLSGGFRRSYYKVSDGTETNIQTLGAGACCVTVYRGPTQLVWLADGSSITNTPDAVHGGSESGYYYAYTQSSSAGSAITAPAEINLRGQSAAGAFFRVGAADELSTTRELPTRAFSGGASTTLYQTYGLYGGTDTSPNVKVINSTFTAPNLIQATYPANVTAGSLLLIDATSEAEQVGTTVSGWTLEATEVTAADGIGPALSVWSKQASGGESGDVALSYTPTTPGTSIIHMAQYRKSSGSWSTAIVTGEDATAAGADFSVTGSSTLACTTGDFIAVMVAGADDATLLTSPSLTIPGCVVSSMRLVRQEATTVGTDVAGSIFIARVLAGTATGAPVFTATTASGVARGAAGFMRLRAA